MNYRSRDILRFIRMYWVALRPFSLTLAFAAVAYGIAAAALDGHLFNGSVLYDWLLIILVTAAGIASQAGANLINDYFEGSFKYLEPGTRSTRFLGRERTYFDIFVFLSGLAFLGLAALIGIYLIYITDLWMLLIGFLGIFGSYAYTGEPFVYKRRGLGVPLSFLLMGPLMSFGAYYPFAGGFSLTPLLICLPGSLLVPSLMISNEMRDFKRDHRLSLGTLSVRIGSSASRRLFEALLIIMYLLTVAFSLSGIFPVYALFALATLPLAVSAWKRVRSFERLSIPTTNRLHLLFNAVILGAILTGILRGRGLG